MSAEQLWLIAPWLLIAAGAVVALLAIAARRHRGVTAWIAGLSLAAGIVATLLVRGTAPGAIGDLLRVDAFALLYTGLILGASLVVLVLWHGVRPAGRVPPEELYVLLLLAALGACVLVASTHLATLFLGLELLGVGLYGMIAYRCTAARSIEAGLKYLIPAGAASAILLFGWALIYAAGGQLTLDAAGARLAAGGPAAAWTAAGLALFLAGAGFKLAAVPFHMWAPDVYQGAPIPVTAFVSTVSKGAMLGLLARFAVEADLWRHPSLGFAVALVAGASMLVGNLLALLQGNVKRLLAYSSVAHVGYMLVALLSGREIGVQALSFYLAAYFATTLAAFSIIGVLSTGEREAERVDDVRGLFWTRPWLALGMTVSMLSLAGIPLTGGFLGKLWVLGAGVTAALWGLALILVAGSVIGLYYYLRVVVTMFRSPHEQAPAPAGTFGARLALALMVLLVVWLGTYPAPLLGAIESGAASLF